MNDTDYPPVALGRLDDESGWRWLSPRPQGVLDWVLTLTIVALGVVPVLAVMGLCWCIRRFGR